jgi:hypothetical protein
MQSISRNETTSPQDPLVLNLQTVKKASLFDTIHLLLLIENLSDQAKYVKIIFPDDIKVRGFLKYIGFTDFLRDSINRRPQGKYLSIFTSSGDPLPDVVEYNIGKKIFPVLPTSSFVKFFNMSMGDYHAQLEVVGIQSWINQVEKYQTFPLIQDGEFLSFIGFQLVKNVEEHAKVNSIHEIHESGFLGMRLVNKKAKVFFDPRLKPVLERADDVLEVCIGDRGVGIIETLSKTYQEKLLEHGFKNNFTKEKILAFSVHELGTSKPPEQRIGSVHALHRILRSLAKYGGAMRIRSGGHELFYDLSPATKTLERYDDCLGIKPYYSQKTNHIPGTQIQLLIPLVLEKKEACKVYLSPPSGMWFQKNRIIPIASFSNIENITEKKVQEQIASDTERLSNIGLNELVVYDFSGKAWCYEEVAAFLETQADILARKRCVAIEVPEDVMNQLSIAENAFHDIIRGNPNAYQADFFYILCDKHRILPVLTTDKNLKFLGFGGNTEAEQIVRKLFETGAEELAYENSPIEIYHKANDDLLQVKEGYYYSRLTRTDIILARSESILLNMQDILERTGAWQRKGIYRLPTSKKRVREFLWTLPVLENLTYNRQVGKWLAEGARKKLAESPTEKLLLLCITAPAEMVARAVAKELPDIKHYIINLGHFGALDDDGLLTDNLLTLPSFIVSDLVRDGKSTEMTITFLQERWEREDLADTDKGKLLGLLSFLNMDKIENFVQPMTWKYHEKFNLECFFVANVEKTKDEVSSENTTGEEYIIEPFSLKPYKFPLLKGHGTSREFKKKQERLYRRIKLAEEAEALRAGHWVSGKHHFKLTTCIPKIIYDETLGGKILNKIGKLCIDNAVNHLLVPFHSNIRHIIPKLKRHIAMQTGFTLDSTYTVEARALASSSFYIPPEQLKTLVKEKAQQIFDYQNNPSGNAPDPLKLLIIDDAIYSGRTIETILRALIREIRKQYNNDQNQPLLHSLIERVDYFAIIDRKGRAKGTHWKGIRQIYLYGKKDEKKNILSDDPYFDFEFHHWIAIDMPTESKSGCTYCNERRWLNHILHVEKNDIKFIQKDIKDRIRDIKPYGVESPEFIHDYQSLKFKKPIEIMGREYTTFEAALWEIHTRRGRGCPFDELVEIFRDNVDSEDENVEKLRFEIGIMIFENWKQFTANWAHKGDLKLALEAEIMSGTKLIRQILPAVGAAYAMPDIEGRGELQGILSSSAARLNSLTRKDDPHDKKVDNLLRGLEMAWLYFVHTLRQNQQRQDEKIEILRDKIISKVDSSAAANTTALMACNELKRFINHNPQRPFIPSLLFLMDHTIRAMRHGHAHLIPSLLSRLIKSAPHANYNTAPPFKKISIDYFGKTLTFFAEALEIACQQDATFQQEITVEFGVTAERSKKLAVDLQEWTGWGEDTKKDKIVLRRANMLAHIFPCEGSDIITALEKRLTTPNDIFQALKEKCQKSERILLKAAKNVMENKSLCIVQGIEPIVGFFANYLDETVIKEQVTGKAFMTIEEKPQDLALTLHTNFECPESMSDPAKGHGAAEAGTLPFVLYEIKIKKAVPEKGYEFAITLEMWKGFRSRRN